MRALLTTIPLALSLFVGGCTPDQSASFIKNVQQIAVVTCGFLPAAETVAGIVAAAAGGPAGTAVVGTATTVADAICGAVTRKTAVRGRVSTPRVLGVRVRGRFIVQR